MPNYVVDIINNLLIDDTQKNALDFINYLTANNMVFERGKGYWDDKYYWMIKYNSEYICFILVGGEDEKKDNSWIIWSDDSASNGYENYTLDERKKKIAYANVDFCGNCGSCSGGTSKTIFGRTFDNVCRTTFRFDNPDSETVECVKKLIEIRINDISVMNIPGHNFTKAETHQ